MRPFPLAAVAQAAALASAVVLAGCGSAGSSPPSSPAGSVKPAGGVSQQAQPVAGIDDLVALAKQEGKITIVCAPGETFRSVFDTFSKKYGIQYELLPGNGNADLVPKIDTERKAGLFNWDVIVHSPASQFAGFKPLGDLDPLRPVLLPAIQEGSKWTGGFDAGWNDSGKALSYSFTAYLIRTVYVNRSLVPESAFNKYDQLWDPQYRAKIASFDPRPSSVGTLVASGVLVAKGEDKLRALYGDQQPALTQDRRQLAEWLVRGQYPLALGEDQTALKDLSNAGVDLSQVKPLIDDDPGSAMYSAATGAVALFNRAPHPNAARLFINWLLSQEGQTVYTQKTTVNSLRTDVAPTLPAEMTLDPKRSYLNTQIEENFAYFQKASAITRDAIK